MKQEVQRAYIAHLSRWSIGANDTGELPIWTPGAWLAGFT